MSWVYPSRQSTANFKVTWVFSGFVHLSCENPPGRRINSLDGQLLWCLSTLTLKIFFLVCNWNFPCCNICPFPLILSVCLAGWLHLLCNEEAAEDSNYLCCPLSFLFFRLSKPRSRQCLLVHHELRYPSHPGSCTLDTLQFGYVLHWHRGRGYKWALLQLQHLKCWKKGNNYLLQPASCKATLLRL